MTPDERQDESLTPAERRLVDVAIEGAASDEELAALDRRLREEPATRRYYRQMSLVHATLRWIHRGEQSVTHSAFAGQAARSPAERPVRRRRWISGARMLGGAAAVAALIAGIVVLRQLRSPDTTESRQPSAPTTVAELRSERNCVWENQRSAMSEGAKLASGQRLTLREGSAKLQFDRGADVVLEGPAEIELISAVSIRLVHGTVAVRVSGRHKEFVVFSPDASIVDLGTSFGVHRGMNESTEVEVFEGAVEVFPNGDDAIGKVLGVGASARVRGRGETPVFDMSASMTDHFANVLELLWTDVPRDGRVDARAGDTGVVSADFSDGPTPGSVDTFYGAAAGRGWDTPWMAWGNPVGELTDEKPLSMKHPLRLGLKFHNSYERAVARLYGEAPGFDPDKPHMISWQWRFDGEIEDFSGGFLDRISFYGNPFFRRNSWPTNTWVVGVVAGDEIGGKGRRMLPMQWYAYDGHADGKDTEMDRRNMVGSGMMLKPGVAYRFAVAVYPQRRQYDVAIRDDEQTFTRTGLRYRNPAAAAGRVVHFTVSTDKPDDDLSFTIDSIRIDPLGDGLVESRVAPNDEDRAADELVSP
jgi:ferric-dicitrate binding protein FerR (iron transport regulator)